MDMWNHNQCQIEKKIDISVWFWVYAQRTADSTHLTHIFKQLNSKTNSTQIYGNRIANENNLANCVNGYTIARPNQTKLKKKKYDQARVGNRFLNSYRIVNNSFNEEDSYPESI